jgi:tetratricopeptide (TPR) repeat protein
VRKTIFGEAARLAERLAQPDRALANWNRRLEIDAEDLEARDALIELLATNKRWAELVAALQKRAAAPVLPQQRRADLVRAARILSDELARDPDATTIWLEVREGFGDEPETLDALDALLAKTGRWSELAELLTSSAGSGRARAARTFVRIGDIHRQQLGDPDAAADSYARALGVEPADAEARAGLRALLPVPSCGPMASEALAQAFRITGDWEAGLSILEQRLAAARRPEDKARLLRESANLYETRANDSSKAHELLASALPFAPEDLALEQDLLRLAEETGAWAETAATFELASDSSQSQARSAQLLFETGRIREKRLDDAVGATDAYAKAASLDPRRIDSQEAVSRCAARAGRWNEAASAGLLAIIARERPEGSIIDELDAAANAAGSYPALANAFEAAIQKHASELRPTLLRALELLVATWWERAGDVTKAVKAAMRGVDHEPTHPESLARLAHLQRKHPGPDLMQTLLRLDALAENDLDHLREGAGIGLAAGSEHVELTRQTLVRLYRKAARMWSRGDQASGKLTPEEGARWSLEQLVDLSAATEPEQAVRMLLDGATLPVDVETSRDLRRRAAELLAQSGDYGRAIDLYTGVLADAEPRLEDIARVATLCEQEDRVSELIGLRLRELEMTESVNRRLELRLELSRLTGVLEERGGRVETLRENLIETPGHPESIAALSDLLEQRGRYDELASILAEQAAQMPSEPERASGLYLRAAKLAETYFAKDPERAINNYRRAVELVDGNAALDALARLYIAQDRPDAAAKHLERRLEATPESERVAILLKLARARIAAEQREKAVQALETAFAEAPRNGEVRKLLIRLHRERDDKEALARTLSTAATAVGDPNTVVAYAREAAELYEELGTPEAAVPVLERAHEFANDDRRLKVMLADGLRGAGRLDEARTLLEALIESFGRRRSAERAEVHVRLARVAHAQDKVDEAIDQLEQASKMAAGNVSILRALAETSHSAGQLDRAERAYRTLLLSLRRGSEGEEIPVTPAEVYLALASIAKDKGEGERVAELQESVLEAIAADDSQAPKLQKALRKVSDFALLRRVLETRLANVKATRRRAKILGSLGDVLEHDMNDSDGALNARLEAVETDPSSPLLHDAVKDLAIRLGRTERYAKLLEDRLSAMRRGDEALVRCELLLRLGEVMESRKDYARASELYGEAEQTGVRQVDVWRAQSRVAGSTGDNERQVELLGRLANLGADQAETRADARFRMAEVHLADEETIADGIAALNAALEDDARWGRAAMILSRACEQHANNDALLELYEKVARRSDDPKVLLHCLEHRLRQPEATIVLAKETVDLALGLQDWTRAEELMLRAVEIARGVLDGLAQVDWALLGLAERRREAGDLAGAVKWLTEAAELAPLDKVLPAAEKLAADASGPDGDLTLAVKLYERVVERDPTIRAAWEPLAKLYAQLGEVDRLERLVEETLDGIQDAKDRNVLRLRLARTLLRSETRAADAVQILNNALLENPEETEANILLAEHLERSGNVTELLELLRNQLMAAQGRRDAAAVKTLSLELAGRLRASDLAEALSVVRQALDSQPNDTQLISTLLEWGEGELDEEERAGLMERRLLGASDAEVGALAIELANVRAAMGEADGELRALEEAYARVPHDEAVRQRLEGAYRATNDWKGLSRMLVTVAGATENIARRVELLREAAVVQRDQLGDAEAAIALLREASEVAPNDVPLRIDLAAALGVSGHAEDAIATLSQTLDSTNDAKLRLQLLTSRAKVRRTINKLAEAIEDLEQAHTIAGSNVGQDLEHALEALRMAAAAANDLDGERGPTMRLIALREARGARGEARELLAGWVDRSRKDLEALHKLARIEEADQNWEGVTKVAGRLVALESGASQVDAALLLSQACRALGRPAEARQGLEFARRKQPEVGSLRAELQIIYAETGANRELADLLIEEVDATADTAARLALLRRSAKIYLDLQDPASAAVPLQAILEIDPSDAESVGLLADAYTQSGQYEEAEAIIDAAIESAPAGRSPELATLQLRKARLAEARGDRETQLSMLEKAFANDKQNGFIAAALADLAEELENWDLATKVLRQIALLETECPISRAMSFVRQGRISLILGDAKRAIFWARRATKEDPDCAEANALLAEVQG